jgi:hypothetical protein
VVTVVAVVAVVTGASVVGRSPVHQNGSTAVPGEVRLLGPAGGEPSDPPGPAGTHDDRVPAAIGGGLVVRIEDALVVGSDVATNRSRFAVSLADLGLHPEGPATSEHASAGELTASVRAHDDGAVVARGGGAVGLDEWGSETWRHHSDRWDTTVVAADRERTVLSGRIGPGDALLLEVLDTTDGRVRFSREVAALVAIEEHTALVRDLSDEGGLTAVSLQDGEIRWQLSRQERTRLDPPLRGTRR